MRIAFMAISTILKEALMRFGDYTKIYYRLNHIFCLLNFRTILKYLANKIEILASSSSCDFFLIHNFKYEDKDTRSL